MGPGVRRDDITLSGCFAELRPLYAGMWVHDLSPNKKTTGGNHDKSNTFK
jgi:hypothetical protein